MLIAVLSDTHLPRGPRRLPDACVEQVRAADLLLHAGDFTRATVLDGLGALQPRIAAVHGNMDDAELLRALPARRVVEARGARIGMVHDAGPAAGRLKRLHATFPDCVAVVFGHSHLPLHEEAEGFQIFNPGSPTERRRAPRHTMGLARVEAGGVRFQLLPLD